MFAMAHAFCTTWGHPEDIAGLYNFAHAPSTLELEGEKNSTLSRFCLNQGPFGGA